jgi:hypothetical protein
VWMVSFEPVYSKSENFEAQDILNYTYFSKKKNLSAKAAPGEQVILMFSPKIFVI